MTSFRRKVRPGSAMVVDLAGHLSATDRYSDTDGQDSSGDEGDREEAEQIEVDEFEGEGLGTELNLQDVEVDISDDETGGLAPRGTSLRRGKIDNKGRPKLHRELVSAQTIMVQPEIKLMQLEKERELNRQKHSDPYQQRAEEEITLVKRFPWLAEKLKKAWDDDKNPKGKGKMKTALNFDQKKNSQKRSRFQSTSKSNGSSNSKGEQANDQAKVVFSRNMPLFIYNTEQKKCIRVGGDRTNATKSDLEEVYRAIHFNPELKKITLDLDDIRFPDKEKTIRLALSYISSNTLHNPFVLNDDFYKYSWKKEVMIKELVQQIEKRLQRQMTLRRERSSRLKVIDEAIQQQKEEEELRERDFVTANRLLEESKEIDQEVLTQYEKNQERKRRIRLRTKSMPTAARAEVQVRQRRHGLPHISLNPD